MEKGGGGYTNETREVKKRQYTKDMESHSLFGDANGFLADVVQHSEVGSSPR